MCMCVHGTDVERNIEIVQLGGLVDSNREGTISISRYVDGETG
jgi:hypothetical protein